MAPMQASRTSWYYHPAILSLAGGAVAYTLYRLYTASNRFATSSLRRSNAIRQPRSRLSGGFPYAHEDTGLMMTYYPPTRSNPLGLLIIFFVPSNSQPSTMTLRLGFDLMPLTRDLAGVQPDPEAAYREILTNALIRSLGACVQLRHKPHLGVPLYNQRDNDFQQLWIAVTTRDEAALTALAPKLPLIFGMVSISSQTTVEISHGVVHSLLATEWWQLPPGFAALEPLDDAVLDVFHGEPANGMRGLLYYISEENAARRAYIHRGIRCEGCNEFPILGIRYHCLNCPDYDLCATCEAHAVHPKTHVFAKIKIPLSVLSQPPKPHKLWYTGDPRKLHPSLDIGMRKQLCTEFGFQEEDLDALYDQFTCIANVSWHHDPSKVAAAIDRRAFDRTMTSDRWPNRFAPNVILDRMFAFYDTDCNSLIGFKEFVSGMDYLRGSNRFASLRRALQGFDIDGDSYVTKADFVRILRAKFEIQKQLIIDGTEGFENERSMGAMDILRSSQPISSVFNGDDIPTGGDRRPRGKETDQHGDMVPHGAQTTILGDEDPFFEEDQMPEREVLVAALDTFEEELDGRRQAGAWAVDGTTDSEEAVRTNTLRVLQAMPAPATTPKPYVQQLLWHYKEEGLNSLLDPLFSQRAVLEEAVSSTREERERWRTAIVQFRENENITSDAELAAWEPPQDAKEPPPRGIVPTDDKTLEQRELDTTRASLESLLEISGYSIREETRSDAGEVPGSAPPAPVVSVGNGPPSTQTLASSSMQDMQSVDHDEMEAPNLVETGSQEQPPSTPRESPPARSKESSDEPLPPKRLHLLAQLEAADCDMRERGGPGRLSLDEIEKLIVEHDLVEVRGLVKSWLDWCAF